MLTEGVDMCPRALVVADDPSRAERWSGWLEHSGFVVVTCPGPALAWNCPRVVGLPCVRREMADVAVVDLSGERAARDCTRLPDDDTTVFVSDVPMGSSAPYGPAALLAAVGTALAAPSRTRVPAGDPGR